MVPTSPARQTGALGPVEESSGVAPPAGLKRAWIHPPQAAPGDGDAVRGRWGIDPAQAVVAGVAVVSKWTTCGLACTSVGAPGAKPAAMGFPAMAPAGRLGGIPGRCRRWQLLLKPRSIKVAILQAQGDSRGKTAMVGIARTRRRASANLRSSGGEVGRMTSSSWSPPWSYRDRTPGTQGWLLLQMVKPAGARTTAGRRRRRRPGLRRCPEAGRPGGSGRGARTAQASRPSMRPRRRPQWRRLIPASGGRPGTASIRASPGWRRPESGRG